MASTVGYICNPTHTVSATSDSTGVYDWNSCTCSTISTSEITDEDNSSLEPSKDMDNRKNKKERFKMSKFWEGVAITIIFAVIICLIVWVVNGYNDSIENNVYKEGFEMNIEEWNDFTEYHLQIDTRDLENVLLEVTEDTYTFYIGNKGIWLEEILTGTFDSAYEREEFELLVDRYFTEGSE